MKWNLFLSTGLLAVLTLVAARGSPTPVDVPNSESVAGYVSVLGAVRAQGATVEPNGKLSQPFFSVKGRLIRVDSQDIQVFEHAYHELVSVADQSLHPTKVVWFKHTARTSFTLDGGPHPPDPGIEITPGVAFNFLPNLQNPYSP